MKPEKFGIAVVGGVFVVTFSVLIIGAVLIASTSRFSGTNELSCGSVGRLVATAEAIVEDANRGMVYVRIGEVTEGMPETMSIHMYRLDLGEGTFFSIVGLDAYVYVEGVTPCQMIAAVANTFGVSVEDVVYDRERAVKVDVAFNESPREEIGSFRVRRGFGLDQKLGSYMYWEAVPIWP